MTETMRPDEHPRKAHDEPRPVSVERLGEILSVYGADARRWPACERQAAERLVLRSSEASAMRREAAELDALLDLLQSEEALPAASPDAAALADRVMAAAPRPRSRRLRTTLVAVVPLAAAAVLAVWIAMPHGTAAVRSSSSEVPVGQYSSPTDVLLEPWGIDISDSMPSFGCADSELGCSQTPAPARQSSRVPVVRTFA
ncbi:MAG TPA: hypothetical protein VGK20_17875 [Candidatus Binatia bacterium]|jgi:hypothetical protein